jgi:type IV secretory pathway ATPase VirB11/archaellum biosynthesis ATPase
LQFVASDFLFGSSICRVLNTRERTYFCEGGSRLSWPPGREHIAFKLREKELGSGVNLFDALMNAARIDKDAILIPQFVRTL